MTAQAGAAGPAAPGGRPESWTGGGAPGASREQALHLVEAGRAALLELRPQDALDAYARALALAESSHDATLAALVHLMMGEIHEGAERVQQALAFYERGLEVLEGAGPEASSDLIAEAMRALRGAGKMVSPSTGPPVATDLYRGEVTDPRALLGSSGPGAEVGVLLMINAGNMYLGQSQHPQADGLYTRALETAGRAGLGPMQARIRANLAWSALKNRRLAEAASWLESLAREPAGAALSPDLRRAHLALGVMHAEEGKVEEAMARLERVPELYRVAGDGRGHARAQAHLASALARAGRLERARDLYRGVLAEGAEADADTRRHAEGGLAHALLRMGDPKGALEHFERYVDLAQKSGDDYHTDQGRMSFLENQTALFDEYLEATLEATLRGGDHDRIRRAVERLRDRSLRALQQNRMQSRRRPPGRIEASLVPGLPFVSDRGRLASPRMDYSQVAPGVPLAPDNAATPNMEPGARLLDEEGGPPAPVPRVEPPQVTFLEYYLLPDRTVILVSSPSGVHVAMSAIGAEELEGMLDALARGLDVAEPRGLARPDGTRGRARGHAAGRRGRGGRRGGGSGHPARGDGAGGRRTEAEDQPAPWEPLATRLHALLVEPVRSRLPGEAGSPVVIVPHRALWRLPFALLRDAGGSYFGDRHLLTYAASAETWRAVATTPRPADHTQVRAWIVGNPRLRSETAWCADGARFEPLPNAEEEARAVAEALGPDRAHLFTGAQADLLRLEAWHGDFTLLHLATHGLLCKDDPLGSFLVLARLEEDDTRLEIASARLTLARDDRFPITVDRLDAARLESPDAEVTNVSYPGVLDARTIAERFRFHADLVTLSACQTGRGREFGQGTVGLTRALLGAGARSVLVSLWNVDDAATKDLMTAFYHEYLAHGDKALALQRAMKETRALYPQPQFWAAFRLVGMAR